MTVLDIVTKQEGVLLEIAQPVADIAAPEIQQLIDDMIDTMRNAEGVGLAGPQIGQPLRLAVVETLPEYDEDGEAIEGSRQLYVLINPKVQWSSRKMVTGIEGCLSIPGYLGEVERHYAIIVQFYMRNGKKKRLKLNGWDARIFQHEIDHLDGVLYTDKLTSPENYWDEETYDKLQDAKEAEEEAEAAASALE